MKINFSPPDITNEEIEAVVDVLKSGWITTGPKTKQFEREIADYCSTPKAVCVNSATIGMELVLRLLDVGPGDEVITSAYTYSASAAVINHVGAKIILADCQKDSFLIDYDDVESKITSKTKVIIPVDIGGVVADSERLIEIADKYKNIYKPNNDIQRNFGRIVILADAAHSIGSVFRDKKSGSIADFSCFSFHAVKNLTTAEGGAITWAKKDFLNDDLIYKELMLLALHGQDKDALSKLKPGAWEYDIIHTGYKANMTDLSAALGLVQLKRYDGILRRRKEIIQRYNENFSKSKIIVPFKHYNDDMSSCGHLYLTNLKGKDETYRNSIIEKMAELGIATNVHYKPLPMMTAYKNLEFNIEDFPNSFNLYKNELTLPLHTLLSDNDVDFISESLLTLLNENN